MDEYCICSEMIETCIIMIFLILILDLITRETYVGLCLVPSQFNNGLTRLIVVGQSVQEWILQLVKTLQDEV